jgi:hypothetical protein
MRKLLTIVLFINLFACSSKNKKPNQTNKSSNSTVRENNIRRLPPLIKNISQLNEDTCSIHWYGGGLFSLCFENKKVRFFFTPQCIYWYRTKLDNDKLIFFWSYNGDCVFDRGLDKKYGVKKPIVGAPFGEFSLINDTTLLVKYYYPNWVKVINEHEKDVDTLFPVIFKMKRK